MLLDTLREGRPGSRQPSDATTPKCVREVENNFWVSSTPWNQEAWWASTAIRTVFLLPSDFFVRDEDMRLLGLFTF